MTNSAHPFIVSKNFSMPILVSYSKTISMPILVSYSKTISMFILVSTLVRPFLCRPVLMSYSKTTPTLVLVTGSQMTFLYILLSISQTIWRAQWKKGITIFDNPKRSKVNNNFLVSRKITRLDINSTQIQLLNFSHNSLLDNENASLTFDLLESSKTVIPFFHWALHLCLVPIYHCFDSNRVFIGGKDSNAIAWKTWILLANSLVPRLPCTEIQTWQLWGWKELSIFSHMSDIKV